MSTKVIIMQTISATELARSTRDVLDRVATGGETLAIERNHALIAMIGPVEPSMTASQAMAGLPPAMLTPVQAAAWLQDSRDGFEDAVVNPWG